MAESISLVPVTSYYTHS